MKILIAVNHFSPSIGGSEYVTKTIADYFCKEHEVCILTRRTDRVLGDYPYKFIQYRSNFQEVSGAIKAYSPNVMLVYSDMFDFFRDLVISPFHIPGCKVIVAPCGANWLHNNSHYVNMMVRNVERISYIVCHSKIDRDYKLCSASPFKEKTIIIPNGVFPEQLGAEVDKKEVAQKLSLDPSKLWILNVSNFFPGKGQQHLLQISKLLSDVDHQLIQVSSDVLFTQSSKILESQWIKEKNRLGVNAVLLKNIDRKDIFNLMTSSNVFVNTSEKEVAPIVMLEVMASKMPWISANVGNVTDLQGGYVIQLPRDSNGNSVFNETSYRDFAEATRRAIHKPTLGEDGRKQVLDQYNWHRILPMYKSIVVS